MEAEDKRVVRAPAPPFVDDNAKTLKEGRMMLDDDADNDSDKKDEEDWW